MELLSIDPSIEVVDKSLAVVQKKIKELGGKVGDLQPHCHLKRPLPTMTK